MNKQKEQTAQESISLIDFLKEKRIKYKETPNEAIFDKEGYDFFKKKYGKVWANEKLKQIKKGKWCWK